MQGGSRNPPRMFPSILLLAAALVSLVVVAVEHDVSVTTPPDAQVKCACEPCDCTQKPPPPPPPPPQPIWSEPYCPPPPALLAPYFYIVGSPGNLYPYDSSFEPSSASRSSYVGAVPVVVIGVAGAFALVIRIWRL